MEKEYLKLFKNVKDDEELKMIKETPDYNNMPSVNEVQKDASQFNINKNLNDGWNIDFQFETRVNGEVQKSNNVYEQKKSRRVLKNKNENLNGLNKYLEEDNLNKKVDVSGDVVTLEMFNEMRKLSMQQIYNMINS